MHVYLGKMSVYSGCNIFGSNCIIHDEASCRENQLCSWNTESHNCIDVTATGQTLPNVHSNGREKGSEDPADYHNSQLTPEQKVIKPELCQSTVYTISHKGDKRRVNDAATECKHYVTQPVVILKKIDG